MEITLDGGEISILKALGLGGSEVEGSVLLERLPQLEPAELIDTLKGLLMLGYVSVDKGSFNSLEEMKKLHFRVNSGYSKDLKEALDPKATQGKSKRVRRE
jgi:hypothetical protein